MTSRLCQRQGCQARARATLTFAYADQTVAIGPLSPAGAPEGIDLCQKHAERFSPPQGWEVVRLPLEAPGYTEPEPGDLKALADAVREAAGLTVTPRPAAPPPPANVVTLAERRHLRVVADPAQARRAG